jgi:DNA-binding HxlR family transcriptional regulator
VGVPGPKDLGYLTCSVANTASIIGDRWNVLILRDAFMGVRRFEDFQKDLGIARNILSRRLEMLVGEEILRTEQYQDRPPRNEYRLTDKGKDLFDVLLALWRWGDKWSPPQGVELRRLVHLDCGKATHLEPVCAECGGALTRRNVRIEPPLDVVAGREQRDRTPV